jgi:spore coat polysaccharide biosynthesis protein SpsF
MAEIDFPETLIILQARTGSSRLPNKVMRSLHGIPLLIHCITRLRKVAKVLVATSDKKRDDSVEELATMANTECFRGSEEDVLDRYYQVAKKFQAAFVIRATGDNPLVDIEEACRVRELIIKGELDYVTGAEIVAGKGLPIGVGIEAFSYKALERSWHEGHAEHHREHVNEYILENPDSFNIKRLKCLDHNSCPNLRLTIDTEEDFLFVGKIIVGIKKPPHEIRTREIIEWWEKTAE